MQFCRWCFHLSLVLELQLAQIHFLLSTWDGDQAGPPHNLLPPIRITATRWQERRLFHEMKASDNRKRWELKMYNNKSNLLHDVCQSLSVNLCFVSVIFKKIGFWIFQLMQSKWQLGRFPSLLVSTHSVHAYV